MMMAHDRTPDRPELSAASIATLESVLQEFLANEKDPSSLQAALRSVAAEARAKEMHAEQLLVALKDVWFSLPEVGQAHDALQQRLLQRIVTLCIREYYSTS